MSLAIGARGEANERQDKQKRGEKKFLWWEEKKQKRKKKEREEEKKREEKGEDPLEVKRPSAFVPSVLPTQSSDAQPEPDRAPGNTD